MRAEQRPPRGLSRFAVGILALGIAWGWSGTALAELAVSPVFQPSTMGPGSISTLSLSLSNTGGAVEPLSEIGFELSLPAGVEVATPSRVWTNCLEAELAIPGVASDIELSGARLAWGARCRIRVDVTSGVVAPHELAAITVNSSAGILETLPTTLTVVNTMPGFSMSIAPATQVAGIPARVTYTVDNSLNASDLGNIDFTTHLPAGVVVATPANASTDCGNPSLPGEITAEPGSSTINLDVDGFVGIFSSVLAGATCTAVVDVVALAGGRHDVDGGELLSNFTSSGRATATLVSELREVTKRFAEVPITPGGQTDVVFTITNRHRTESAADIAFDDDLDTALSGLLTTSLPDQPCGPASSLTGGGVLSLSGGQLAPGETCSFTVGVQVPAGAAHGSYPSNTGEVSYTVDTQPRSWNGAVATLEVQSLPVLTREFVGSPVVPGEEITLRYTLTAGGPAQAITDLAFTDELTNILPFPLSATLPPTGSCGAGMNVSFFFPDSERQGLQITGGSLTGGSCSFDIPVGIPADMSGGVFPQRTSTPTATVDGVTVSLAPAEDTLVVHRTPRYFKDFIGGPVLPGETVTLEYTLTLDSDANVDATGITFTDDFSSVLAGLVAEDLPQLGICGQGSELVDGGGGQSLELRGASLTPGDECVFSVTLRVPGDAPPTVYLSTSSEITAQMDGVQIQSPGRSASFEVAGFEVVLSFGNTPALPGDVAELRLTVNNTSAVNVDSLSVSLNVLDFLPAGAALAENPADTPCAGGTLISIPGTGISFLSLSGLAAGNSCEALWRIQIPPSTDPGDYLLMSGQITSVLGGQPRVLPPATATLFVEPGIAFAHEVLNDPVAPGGTATVEYRITNLNPAQALSDLSFTHALGDVMPNLVATGLPSNDVCGAGSQLSGTDTVTLSGGNLAAGASCSFTVDLSVPAVTPARHRFTSRTSNLTGTMPAGGLQVDGSVADLVIGRLLVTKSFDGPTVAGGLATLTFNVESVSDIAQSQIAFIDDLNDMLPGAVATGLPRSEVCGPESVLSGTSLLSLRGGSLPALGSCTFDVEVQIPAAAAPGAYVNATSDISALTGRAADPATAQLSVEPPPTFTMSFAPPVIGLNTHSTLSFVIDNTASVLAASSLDFTDNLPAGVQVATPSNALTTCTGGTLLAVAGGGVVSYTGGQVAAGASCTLSVDVIGVAVGTATNITTDLTSSSGNSGPASAELTVDPNPGFTKSFTPDIIPAGAVSTLTFVIDNTGSTLTAGSLDFTDNLPAGMTVAAAPNVSTTCIGGTLTAVSASAVVSYVGGQVPPGTACTLSVDVTSSTLGEAQNTSGALTSSSGRSGSASHTLRVEPLPAVEKSFEPATVWAGQPSTLRFTITNPSVLIVSELSLTDNLPAGLALATPAQGASTCAGGTVTAVDGGTVLSYADGGLAAGEDCTVSAQVVAANPDAYVNISEPLTSSSGDSGTANATLSVQPRPGFAKAFDPATIPAGMVSTLTFTISNPGTLDATDLAFTDNLPEGTLVAAAPNAVSTCDGGLLSAVAGGNVVSYAGGGLAAASNCTLSVDITAADPGSYMNTSEALASSAGDSGTASAPLLVEPLPVFAKSFDPSVIPAGGVSRLTFAITNEGTLALSALAFTDLLPAGMTVAASADAQSSCTGGTLTADSGTDFISYAEGELAAESNCEISVNVTSDTVGESVNTSGSLTSSSGDSGSATATLSIQPRPSFAKAFAPGTVPAGGLSTLTFTIDNPGTLDLTGLDFSDTFPAGMSVATPPNASSTCVGGTLTAVAGSGVVAYTGGELAADSTCTVSADVIGATPGELENSSGALTSSSGDSGGATATLSVQPRPGFAKAFEPQAVPLGGVSTLTFTINNSGTLDASGLDFNDTFPAGMSVATPANATTSCTGGTLTAVPGSNVISYTGGEVAAGSACTVSADVVGEALGELLNTSGALTSSYGDSGDASATLSVQPRPTFAKAFAPEVVPLGLVSTLTFTIDNPGTLDVTGLDFSDTFPAGLSVATAANAATSCTGGTLTAVSGSSVISYTGGELAAGSTCTVSADVVSDTLGELVNTSGALTSSSGDSGDASATLSVQPRPTFAKAFEPQVVPLGMVSTLTFTIDNPGTLDLTGLDFSDALPAGMSVATAPNAASTCVGGSITAEADSNVIAYTGGELAAGSTCTVSADVVGTMEGELANTSGALTSSSGDSGEASATLSVQPLPTFAKAFAPQTVPLGAVSTLTFTIVNPGTLAATALTFSDGLPAGMSVAAEANAQTTCTGGELVAAPGREIINYSGGELAAGATCTVSVNVTAGALGDAVNTSSALTSSYGDSGSATATLSVQPLPAFSAAFAPATIPAGGVSTLTFTIENAGALAADALAFENTLPEGVLVAETPAATTDCGGGVVSAEAGASVISLSGGGLVAGGSCTVSCAVTSAVLGEHENTSGALSSSLGDSGSAVATLSVQPLPSFAKAFEPAIIPAGGTSTLSFTIDNPGTLPLTDISFSDPLPEGMTQVDPPNVATTCVGGVVTHDVPTNVLSYTGGELAAESSCTVSVDVTSSTLGDSENVTDALSSSSGDSGNATATLSVQAIPSFAKAFEPAEIVVGGVSTLTFTIDNPGVLAATALDFTDTLPEGMTVADPPNAATTCTGGTVVADAGAGSVSYSGGELAAGSSCTVSCDVSSDRAGAALNTSGALTSSLGDSGEATATLDVLLPPTLSKSFDPETIVAGAISTLSFVVSNADGDREVTEIAFTDDLPVGMTVAGTPTLTADCTAGSVNAEPGSSVISVSGGVLSAGASCTISLDITTDEVGDSVNTTSELSSSVGSSAAATATLTVDEVEPDPTPTPAVTSTPAPTSPPTSTPAPTIGTDPADNCNCDTTSGVSSGHWVGLMLLALWRRRRSR